MTTVSKTRVLVYGSLRKGMGNHRLLEGQDFVGETLTKEPYAMYSLGGFPMVSLEGDKVSPIVVEAYDVDDRGLARLNQLEGFHGKGQRNFYDCSHVETVDHEGGLIYHIEGEASRPNPLVEDGNWVNYRKANQRYN